MDQNSSSDNSNTSLLHIGSFLSVNWARVLIVSLLLLAFSFIAAYAGYNLSNTVNNNSLNTINNLTKNNTSSTGITTANPYQGWETYTNNTYQYSFKYPSNWTLDTSKADPSTANNPAASPYTSTVTLSNNGYTFTFTYYLEGIGGIQSLVVKKKNITIDNQAFIEAYTNGSQSCSIFGNITSVPSSCNNSFNYIVINNPNEITTNNGLVGASAYVNFGGRTSIISLSLPSEISLNNSNFTTIDDTFTKILNSIVLP